MRISLKPYNGYDRFILATLVRWGGEDRWTSDAGVLVTTKRQPQSSSHINYLVLLVVCYYLSGLGVLRFLPGVWS